MRTAIRSLILLGALAAGALPFFTHNVHALDPATCNGYADRAVEQSTRARTLSCGFKVDVRGVAWSIDRNAYIRECLAFNNKSTIQNRSLTRDAALDRCAVCRSYASTIIAQNLDNKRFSCGFQGENWVTEDQAAIFERCMDERHPDRRNPWPDFFAPSFLSERASELVECKAKLTDEQVAICQAYASKANTQAHWNADHKCGGTGPRWTIDTDEHFRWCAATFHVDPDVESMKQRVKEQEEGRDAANNRCAFKQAGGTTTRGRRIMNSQTRTKVPEGVVQQPPKQDGVRSTKPVAASSSAMDRIGTGPSASGGSYKSKDGAPNRSSGGAGAGTQTGSSAGELPTLRTMPANPGAMSTGGGTPAWKGSVK